LSSKFARVILAPPAGDLGLSADLGQALDVATLERT